MNGQLAEGTPGVIRAPLIGLWIAQCAFWVLLALGISREALRGKGVGLFVVPWVVGCVGVPRIAWWTGSMLASYVAILDIVLVFIVFKGDVRIT
jgi:hypothetical protein